MPRLQHIYFDLFKGSVFAAEFVVTGYSSFSIKRFGLHRDSVVSSESEGL